MNIVCSQADQMLAYPCPSTVFRSDCHSLIVFLYLAVDQPQPPGEVVEIQSLLYVQSACQKNMEKAVEVITLALLLLASSDQVSTG